MDYYIYLILKINVINIITMRNGTYSKLLLILHVHDSSISWNSFYGKPYLTKVYRDVYITLSNGYIYGRET